MTDAALLNRAKKIRLLCLDVDGTLTDGRLYFVNGVVCRAFNVLDGAGVQRYINGGGIGAIVTAAPPAEHLDAIHLRAKHLGIRHIYTDVKDKLAAVEDILAAESLTMEQTAYVGDDLPDLPPMQRVGLACAPQTAAAEVLAAAHYVPQRQAGHGAVREVCDLLMQARR